MNISDERILALRDNAAALELIQVAAVAFAALQDIATGSTALPGVNADDVGQDPVFDIMYLIESERKHQEKKWGARTAGLDHWSAVLVEEVSEFMRDIGPDNRSVVMDTYWTYLAGLLKAAEVAARRYMDVVHSKAVTSDA